jgi:hypothetical protein
MTIMIAVVVFLVLLGATVGMGWEIFVKRSDGKIVRFVSSAVPIPAGRMGSRTVLYRDFLKARDTLKVFLASPAAKEQGMEVPFDINLERNVLEKLLVQEALEELAEERKIAVSEEELRKYFTEVLAATSSTTPDVGVYLLENFGWNEEDFRQQVLRPSLLEQKLGQELATSQPNDPDALNRLVAARMEKGDVVRYVRF